MEIETSTAIKTAYSQSSSSSSITSFNAPDTTLFLPSVRLLHGNIGREYSIEDDCYFLSGESTARFDYSFPTNLELSNKTSLVTYDINKNFSRNEESIFFKMMDQLNLIDLVRSHQSIDQGSFRKAAPPLSRPINLGLPENFAKENAWLYSCVCFHRLRFKFAKGYEGCLRQKSTEVRDKQAPKHNRSPLSNYVRPDDITDLTASKISIKCTSRDKSCSQSEPYISLLTKQCEQVNSLIIDTSFLERAKYENFHNLDREEIEKEDHYDNDEKDDNDDEDKDIGDYDHHSDSDMDMDMDSDMDMDMDSDLNIDSNWNRNWNSNWNSNKNSEENYFCLKRLMEFLIGYHENDSISNKKLCRGHNIEGVL